MIANDSNKYPSEDDKLLLRNCGYCGKRFACTIVELLIHVDKCEKIKADEYHNRRGNKR
jgi:transcription elongation factor Elf1